ncbi:hypothetical protein BtSCAC15_31540 (plasmid) [Bacillus thuringiensis]|nr:DDE-type integrase/transposase/recombinase [Bacillus thuringiensis]AZR80680.1 hypothetical protein BtSCAC15_31540 [Bacillus thuringiensis]
MDSIRNRSASFYLPLYLHQNPKIRRIKYLNNIVEQDHRFIKKRIRSMLGFKSYKISASILSGVEAIHMVKKEQIDLQDQSVQNQKVFINQLFGLTA